MRRARPAPQIGVGKSTLLKRLRKQLADNSAVTFVDEPVEILLERAGTMPLPPYIASKREIDEADREDYQTRFAQKDGAVAAPTASLHFTDRLMAELGEAGIEHAMLTLHVGAGTFLPVKADDTNDHQMHAEWGRIDAETADRLNAIRARGNRVRAALQVSERRRQLHAGVRQPLRLLLGPGGAAG